MRRPSFTGPAAAAWALLAVAVALMVLLAARARLPELSFYEPAGYVKKVGALIDDGTLRYDPARRRAVLADDAPEEVRSFAAESYLASDMERVGQPGSALYLEDGELRVDPQTHRIDLPFAAERRWSGRLLHRSSRPTAVLEGRGPDGEMVTLRLEAPPAEALPLSPGAYRRLPIARLAGTHRAAGFLLHGRETSRTPVRLEMVGDDPVLSVDLGPPLVEIEVAVDGHRVPEGHRVRLESGDTVLLRRPGAETVLFVASGPDTDTLRREREINGEPRGTLTAEDFPLAAELATGIEALVRTQETREPVRDFDVVLTLDRDLQAAVQERLEAFVARSSPRDHRLDPAAVTLMDLATGDLLALASWPTAEALEGASGLSTGRRLQLARNQNLPLHPVGSAGKPFLAAAAWEVAPATGTLVVEAHPPGRLEEILGLPLDPGMNVFNHQRIDRESFLAKSCNAYLADLVLLTLATPPGALRPRFTEEPLSPRPGASLSTGPIDRRPDLARHVEGNSVLNLDDHPWARSLEEAYGIAVTARGSTDPAVSTAARYDLALLGPLLDWLHLDPATPEGARGARPLFAAAPERVNFRLNQVQRLRQDLVSLLLGGSFGEWSNVRMAAAMARLATGRAVEPRLVAEVRGEGRETPEPEPPGPLQGLSERSLRWVRDGLEGTARPGGTAGVPGLPLAAAVADAEARLGRPGHRVRFYSKTGTAQTGDEAPPWSGAFVFALVVEGPEGSGPGAPASSQGGTEGAGAEPREGAAAPGGAPGEQGESTAPTADAPPPIRGIAGVVWIEDRGTADLAVRLTAELMEGITEVIDDQLEP